MPIRIGCDDPKWREILLVIVWVALGADYMKIF